MAEKRCFGCMNMKTSSPVCEHCGFNEHAQNESHQLPLGTVLHDQYIVGKCLGQGGFGITYLGWDRYLNTTVAIKEFYPGSIVSRDCSHSLSVVSYESGSNEMLQSTRARFLREAQTLAKLSVVEEVVHVRNYFETNNTAYIIMEYVKGIDLRRYINMRGGRLSAEETLNIMQPIMRALSQVHAAGVVHRDISPDNIMMQHSGGAKLLDFGAVRAVEAADVDKELPKSTEAILKHGFAPIEQYQRRGAMGPWTDEYALCATMYYCMTGRIPADAPERMMEDVEINWSAIPGLTEDQIRVLNKGMAVRAKDRYASVEELYDALFAGISTMAETKSKYKPAAKPRQSAAVQPGTQTAAATGTQKNGRPETGAQSGGRERKKKNILLPAAAVILAGVLALTALGGKDGENAQADAADTEQITSSQTQVAPAETLPVLEKKDLVYTYSDGSTSESKMDARGNEVERILRNADGSWLLYTAEYSDSGDFTCIVTYDANMELKREEWDYDASGRNVEYRIYETGELYARYTYEYDSHDNRSKTIRYNGVGSQTDQILFEREYDLLGRQTSSVNRYSDGSFVRFEYDDRGNEIRYESYDENGKLTYARDQEYDAYGNVIQYTIYNGQGNVTNICRSTYDEYGMCLRDEYYTIDDILEYSNEYVYDANGTQVSSTYSSKVYSYSNTDEQMRDIDGDMVRSTSISSSGYRSITTYDLYGRSLLMESYDNREEPYATSQYHYDDLGYFQGYTNTYINTYDNTRTVTEYDSDYKIVDEKSYDANGKLCGWGENFYDENGYLTEEVDYRADGSTEYHRKAVYSDAGKPMESKTIYYDENNVISSESTDVYDENGYLKTNEYRYYRDGKLNSYSFYEYENGRLQKCTDYDGTGKLEGWYIHEYDSQGRNVKTMHYDASGNVERWEENEFDERGNEVKSTCYNADGTVQYWSETFYDENGLYLDSEYHWN